MFCRCGFYLKREGSDLVLEVVDPHLLKKCIKNPEEFEEYCRDLALIYGIKPETVALMVGMWFIGTKAKSEEELKEKASKLGLGLQKIKGLRFENPLRQGN